jgi:hypothetical protein
MRICLITRPDIEFSPAEVDRLLAQGGMLISSAGRTVLVPRLAGGRGPNTDDLKKTAAEQKAFVYPQVATAKWQQNQGEQLASLAAGKEALAQSLFQQPIDRARKLASGDPSTVAQVMAPTYKLFEDANTSARATIFDSVASGAGRDFALSMMPAQKTGKIAEATNAAVGSGFEELTKQAKTMADWGLQEQGASLRAGEGGAQTYSSAASILNSAAGTQSQVAQAEAAKKAATMGFLGDLGGAVAGPITKGIKGLFSKAPAAGSSVSTTGGTGAAGWSPTGITSGASPAGFSQAGGISFGGTPWAPPGYTPQQWQAEMDKYNQMYNQGGVPGLKVS